MNGNSLRYYGEALDDEALDDEAYDDEAYDDETAEFLGDLLQNIPIVGPMLGGLLPKPAPPPLPRVNIPPTGPGVSNATLNTPNGSATLALPASVVKQEDFVRVTDGLRASIDTQAGRINTINGDVSKLRTDFVRVETDTRKEVSKLRKEARIALVKSRREQAAAFAKMRKEQSSQQMTNMMISVMMQTSVQNQLNEHTHTVKAPDGTGDPIGIAQAPTSSSSSSNNSMLMLLPMMMMGDSGSSNDNMMPMMMMMMFASQNQNRGGS